MWFSCTQTCQRQFLNPALLTLILLICFFFQVTLGAGQDNDIWKEVCTMSMSTNHKLEQPEQIKPSERLEYHTCYGNLQCARLTIPMDWNRTDTGEDAPKVDIALVQIPAKVAITDPRYGGAAIINPGRSTSSRRVEHP